MFLPYLKLLLLDVLLILGALDQHLNCLLGLVVRVIPALFGSFDEVDGAGAESPKMICEVANNHGN